MDLLDPNACATLAPRVLAVAGKIDILHANAGTYVGGDLVDSDAAAIDRMLNLNVNVVMKNVHDVLPHMIGRRTGDIIVTSSLAAHFPTPWEPVYASPWGDNLKRRLEQRDSASRRYAWLYAFSISPFVVRITTQQR
jgi:ribitol 2-dehydrogenase